RLRLSCIPLCREESLWSRYSDLQLGSLNMVLTLRVNIVQRVTCFFATHHDSTPTRRPNFTIPRLISSVKAGALHCSWIMAFCRYKALQARERRTQARDWPANFFEPAKRLA